MEEVAASLVREFLSRKVMAGHSKAQEAALKLGGQPGVSVSIFAPSGMGEHSTPCVSLRDSP